MANVIKHKRGSGSDPAANNLVLGELAIRTDTGKLFTKMDSGAIAEIAGGGSDIAINTLSSSSGTGGGSATFNGSAYRFTLSAPPNVSAAQLLVSINGVIQKPVAGTGQPSEGFSVDGTDIILGDAPATGSDFFILTFKSLGVSEPADNSVTSAKIVDGAIVNADINASAAIAGTKISPDFGSQNITTTGFITSNDITISDTSPTLRFTDTNHNSDFRLTTDGGLFKVIDTTNSADRIAVHSDGEVDLYGHVDIGAGLDVTGAITGTGDLTIDTNTLHVDSSNNRVGIGTTSPRSLLDLGAGSGDGSLSTTLSEYQLMLEAPQTTGDYGRNIGWSVGTNGLVAAINAVDVGTSDATGLAFITGNNSAAAERMRIDSSGRVMIGTTTPAAVLTLDNTGQTGLSLIQTEDVGGSGAHSHILLKNTTGTVATINTVSDNLEFRVDDDTVFSNISGTEHMRIDSSGRLLYGLTSSTRETSLILQGNSNSYTTNPGTLEVRIGQVPSAQTTLGQINFGCTGDKIGGTISAIADNADWSSGSSHPTAIRFFTTPGSSTTQAERMRIDSSGFVGIGNTSPTSSHAGARNLVIGDGSGDRGLSIMSGTSGVGHIEFSDGTSNAGEKTAGGIRYYHNGNYMRFNTNGGTERMRIDSSGDVGIGNSSPNCRLAIKDVAEHTAYASVTPSVTESMLQLYNNPPNETANDHATIQFGVNGGSHNRVNSISAVAESAGNRKLAFTFCTDEAGSRAEKMRITGDGNVGIGTTSPGSPLTIDTGGTADALRIGNSAGTDTFIRLGSTGTNTDTHGVIKYDKDDNYLSLVVAGESHGGGGILIANGGNVGIGTTSPSQLLHISAASGDSFFQTDTTVNGGLLINVNGTQRGVFANDSAFSGTSTNLGIGAKGDMIFRAGSSSYIQRLRIAAGGDIAFNNCTSTINSSNYGLYLLNDSDSSKSIYFRHSREANGTHSTAEFHGNQGRMEIMGDGDVRNTNNSYGSTSDETLKQDIVDASSQWNDIKAIRVRKFRFKDNPTGDLHIGVVAQEIETVSPKLVTEVATSSVDRNSTETVKAVKYSVLYMKAIKALQEAQTRIETLEAKVTALEAK